MKERILNNISKNFDSLDNQSFTKGLYIISTPIGNIFDITLRAIYVLNICDVILAEDTRVTFKLLNFYDIKKKLICYNEINTQKISAQLDYIVNNYNKIAIVSDAGTPCISDPGYRIIQYFLEQEYQINIIPGVSAVTSIVAASGLPVHDFMFCGFIPNKTNRRLKFFQEFIKYNTVLIFFESPHRMQESIKDMLQIYGNKQVSIGKELTKMHEKIYYSDLQSFIEHKYNHKGEYVIALNNRT